MDSVTMMDGRQFRVGQRVSFSTKYGSRGSGTVREIRPGTYGLLLTDLNYEERGMFDGWPLKDGGDYDRLRDHGICGGEIV